MNPRRMVATVLLAWSVAVLLWLAWPGETGLHADPARVLVVGSYLLVAPGLAFVVALSLRDKLLAAVVAIGFSASLLILVAQATLYLHIWSPLGACVAVVGTTCAMSLHTVLRPQRRPGNMAARS